MPKILYTDAQDHEQEVPFVDPAKPLLTQLAEAGINYPFLCNFGQCGVCRIVVENRKDILDRLHVREGTLDDLPKNQLLACSTWIAEEHWEDGDLTIRLKEFRKKIRTARGKKL